MSRETEEARDTLLAIAETCIERDETEDAIFVIHAVLLFAPNDPSAWRLLAAAHAIRQEGATSCA